MANYGTDWLKLEIAEFRDFRSLRHLHYCAHETRGKNCSIFFETNFGIEKLHRFPAGTTSQPSHNTDNSIHISKTNLGFHLYWT